MTASGNVSNHYYVRAMDRARVEASPAPTSPHRPCAQLGFALAQLPEPLLPTRADLLLDLDGIGPAFAAPTTAIHHAGYNEY